MDKKMTVAPYLQTESHIPCPTQSGEAAEGYPLNIFFFSTDFMPIILFPAKTAPFRDPVSQNAARPSLTG
jgi:hypothetical protein